MQSVLSLKIKGGSFVKVVHIIIITRSAVLAQNAPQTIWRRFYPLGESTSLPQNLWLVVGKKIREEGKVRRGNLSHLDFGGV